MGNSGIKLGKRHGHWQLSSARKCNWLKPKCTKLCGFLTTSVKQSQTVSKQMVLTTAKAVH